MQTIVASAGRTSAQPSRSRSISPAATSAWFDCRFRKLMGKYADEMLIDTVESRNVAGAELRLIDGPANRMLAFIVEGSARVYTTSAQGRQATVRYVGAGDVMGLATLLAPSSIEDGDVLAVQAMSDCHVLRMSTRRFRDIVVRDPDIMWGLCGELANTLMSSHHMMADNVFQPVRSRVARHLLDMARETDGRLVVDASPQDIADAIGSVREVVSRATVRLRSEGVIRREGSAHVIANPCLLHRIAEEA